MDLIARLSNILIKYLRNYIYSMLIKSLVVNIPNYFEISELSSRFVLNIGALRTISRIIANFQSIVPCKSRLRSDFPR